MTILRDIEDVVEGVGAGACFVAQIGGLAVVAGAGDAGVAEGRKSVGAAVEAGDVWLPTRVGLGLAAVELTGGCVLAFGASAAREHCPKRLLVGDLRELKLLVLLLVKPVLGAARADAALLTLIVRLVVQLVRIRLQAAYSAAVLLKSGLDARLYVGTVGSDPARALQVRETRILPGVAVPSDHRRRVLKAAPRPHYCRFVGKVLGQLSQGLRLVKAVLVNVRFS